MVFLELFTAFLRFFLGNQFPGKALFPIDGYDDVPSTHSLEENMNSNRSRWLLLLTTLMLLAIFVAACAPPASQPAAAEKPVIKFAENPWSGSAVNVAVAKILLEEQMGYPVEVTTLDENAQWTALATGDLHASLEVWPSGHAENVAEYIDGQKVVENGGLLGPVGEIGWFTPKYMIDQHPELATWEGFADPELAKLYATAETGDKGQFLAGDRSHN